jgi:hypothetical protein
MYVFGVVCEKDSWAVAESSFTLSVKRPVKGVKNRGEYWRIHLGFIGVLQFYECSESGLQTVSIRG